MTEKKWLACTDPKKMLEFLRGQATDRKLRLFVYHCFCRMGPANTSEPFRKVVQTMERYADGLASEKQRASAYAKAERGRQALNSKHVEYAAAMVACLGLGPQVLNPARGGRRGLVGDGPSPYRF